MIDFHAIFTIHPLYDDSIVLILLCMEYKLRYYVAGISRIPLGRGNRRDMDKEIPIPHIADGDEAQRGQVSLPAQRFMVEFSLPQPQRPVPVATIRVYFTCLNQEHLKITFRFEKDSLIHTPTKTIRHQEIEVGPISCRNGSMTPSPKNYLFDKQSSTWGLPTKALGFETRGKTPF